MHFAVIGAGIVGVTTAYELAADGHAVTVFERRPSVAAETSFANGGLIAPAYAAPWIEPGLFQTLARGLLGRQTGMRFGSGALGAGPWLWRAWRSGRPSVAVDRQAAMHRLARYSRARMDELAARHQLQFEQSQGLLVLLRTAREWARAQKALAQLAEAGVACQAVDAARCRELEPGLCAETPLAGAISLVDAGVGNCRQFAHQIKAQAQACGADFRFGTEVLRITAGARPGIEFRPFETAAAPASEAFDGVMICAGAEAGRLLAPLGLHLPLAPVYGYSLTATVRHLEAGPDLGPRAGVLDDRHQVTIARLGQRIRVSGGTEIGGHADRLDGDMLRGLYRVLQDWFPGAAELARVQHWKGARPMLPDGPPAVGTSGLPNIWLNLGHGASGFALACGAARLVADQAGGREPAIDGSGLGVERLL